MKNCENFDTPKHYPFKNVFKIICDKKKNFIEH